MKPEEIVNIFTYHKPFGNQAERYERLRYVARLALTNLQQSIMWANASIAINEKDPND
jgi:hypothetical protein